MMDSLFRGNDIAKHAINLRLFLKVVIRRVSKGLWKRINNDQPAQRPATKTE